MLTSIAIILLLGIFISWIFSRIKLPSLLGMILLGLIIGPKGLNILDPSLLNISAQIRQIALVIILTRAGLSLDISDLIKAGRPAVLMCFLPALFEILATTFFAKHLLGLTYLEAAIIGSVISAVSPAVVVPRMIKLIEEGYGTKKSIPQIILAGASVDDVFVIVVFSSLTNLARSGNISASSFLQIPISIFLGIILGIIVGRCVERFFKKIKMSDLEKVFIFLSCSFFLLTIQDLLKDLVSISGLLAIMAKGMVISKRDKDVAKALSSKYNSLWRGAEIFLFVLVGAALDISYAFKAGPMVIVLIFLVMVFRMLAVYISLSATGLVLKEKIFSMFAYIPKATVQAAIGSIPLSMGLECGPIVLTVAVVSILVTAPLGAIFIDNMYKKLLEKA